MLRNMIMWALICAAAPFACAQHTIHLDGNTTDSLDIILNDVIISAKNMITKTDCKVITPPESKIKASTSGLDLLQKLALPGISVNQMTGSITTNSGGVLKIYIDGVPAAENQIASIDPEDVVRIEFHDSPGVRYGNADFAINYIMRKKDNGCRLFLESMNCIGSGKFATLDEISAHLVNGKSKWSINSGYMQMKRDNWIRDYEETWRFPDKEVIRRETGLPVETGNSMLYNIINYQYSHNEKNLFNARFSLNFDKSPNKEEGDRHSLLSTSGNKDITEIWEHTSEESLMPSIALHYRHIFDKSGTLSLNLESSWLKSKINHTYSEETDGIRSCDIFSKTNGNKHGIFAEAIHDIKLGSGQLTSGLRYSQSHTSNNYLSEIQSPAGKTDINQSEISVFSEYNLRVRNLGVIGGFTAKRLSVAQEHSKRLKYAILPHLNTSYKPNSDLFLRYSVRFERRMPPLASISYISQEIQPGMIRRGNPCVKSFLAINQEFSFTYSYKTVNLTLTLGYLDESKPVMNSVSYENGVFVQTFENQKYFRKFHAEAMISVSPWKDHITLRIAPDFPRYFSRGSNYNLVKNIMYIHFGADASYKRFIFTANTMSGPDNYMYGDEIITEKPMNMILAGYKSTYWTLQIGAFNIMKNYWMKTENFSPLTPFKSNAHCGKNTFLALKLSINLNYGKQRDNQNGIPSDISHIDMDSGIVNGLK